MIDFKIKPHDEKLIDAIAERAFALDKKFNGKKAMSKLHHVINIVACHNNGCRLKLIDLLEADDLNFVHDVFGIDRHINKETGELQNCFLPRFAL